MWHVVGCPHGYIWLNIQNCRVTSEHCCAGFGIPPIHTMRKVLPKDWNPRYQVSLKAFLWTVWRHDWEVNNMYHIKGQEKADSTLYTDVRTRARWSRLEGRVKSNSALFSNVCTRSVWCRLEGRVKVDSVSIYRRPYEDSMILVWRPVRLYLTTSVQEQQNPGLKAGARRIWLYLPTSVWVQDNHGVKPGLRRIRLYLPISPRR